MKHTYLTMMALGVALSASGQVAAVNLNQRAFQNATNNCHASLPVFEGALRMRPLGITNDGDNSAFISCSMAINLGPGVKSVSIQFANHGADREISCTLVNGFPNPADPTTFFPKTVPLASGVRTNIAWDAVTENNGVNYVWPNISCQLPSDVEVIFTRFDQDLDVGL